MKFGIREVCELHFEKQSGNGPSSFDIDTAKMNTLEGASTTVYAQGGRGNSRLMAWEGEKTVTFTVEDALITLESFYALTGAEVGTGANNGVKYSIYPTSFAGYYKITGIGLFRDDQGIDHDAELYIPNAKLQTQLNLSMAPSGDPSTFTFTFDAFPDTETKLLFSIDVHGADGAEAMTVPTDTKTTVYIDNNVYSETNATTLTVTGSTIKLGSTTLSDLPSDWKTGAILTDLNTKASYDSITPTTFNLAAGTTTRFYII